MLKILTKLCCCVLFLGSSGAFSSEASDGPVPPLAAPQADQPHLILNFDINKTLILLDPASGKSIKDMLQSALSESIWGLVDADGEWTILSEYTKGLRPTLFAPEGVKVPEGMTLTTYSDHLELGAYKLQSTEGLVGEDKSAGKALNKALKKEKQALKSHFVDEGAPGRGVLNFYRVMRRAYQLPSREAKQAFEAAFPELEGECYFILPSFFKLVNKLRSEGRSFSIVFRTFGHDVHKVTDEFAAFISGAHPLFELQKASKGVSYQKKAGEIFGCLERSDEQTALHIGVTDPKRRAEAEKTLVGPEAIYEFIKEKSLEGTHVSLRDDWNFWNSKAEASWAGKVHMVNTSDETVHSIFIDDNVEKDYAHIIHALDLETGDEIPFGKSINKWIVKADPVSALLDSNFFVKAIAICEANLAVQRAAEVDGSF